MSWVSFAHKADEQLNGGTKKQDFPNNGTRKHSSFKFHQTNKIKVKQQKAGYVSRLCETQHRNHFTSGLARLRLATLPPSPLRPDSPTARTALITNALQ